MNAAERKRPWRRIDTTYYLRTNYVGEATLPLLTNVTRCALLFSLYLHCQRPTSAELLGTSREFYFHQSASIFLSGPDVTNLWKFPLDLETFRR